MRVQENPIILFLILNKSITILCKLFHNSHKTRNKRIASSNPWFFSTCVHLSISLKVERKTIFPWKVPKLYSSWRTAEILPISAMFTNWVIGNVFTFSWSPCPQSAMVTLSVQPVLEEFSKSSFSVSDW